jgi:hypothetical protein
VKFAWEWTGKEATLEELQNHVGPGWADIVKECAEDLFAIGWDGTVTQIKEKFGGLRFYFRRSGIPENLRRVSMCIEIYYENRSLNICEECGKPGYKRAGDWLKTLCKEHAIEKGRALFDWEKEE